MRVLRCAVPGARLDEGIGDTVADTLSYFALMSLAMRPLIDDGAGEGIFRGQTKMKPPVVSRITAEAGLLLCAKDLSTIRRGLEAYPADVTLKSDDGGLGMIATSFDRQSGRSKGRQFVQWGVNNVKQHFLHKTFGLAAWFTKHCNDYVDYKSKHRKLNDLLIKMGGDHLFTFDDFCRSIDHDSMMQLRGTVVLICRTGDIAPGLEVPTGRVMRYINSSVKVRDIGALATRAFTSTEREHVSGGIFN